MTGEDKNNLSIFSGVNNAINKNKRRTPVVQNQGVVQNTRGLIHQKQSDNIEHVQQDYLDWQVNKIAHDLYTRTIYYDTDRVNAYQDFRAMDMSPEIAAALSIMRDECITRGEKGKILDIYSENSRVKTVLEDLFYNRLDIDFALKLWIRDLLKYGDFFLFLHIDKDEGVYDVMALPAEEIHREEGYEGRTDNVRFRWETTGNYFEDWQVAHFRLLEDMRKLPYGRCLKFDTYIETNLGPKFIKDINKGDLVWTFNKEKQIKELSKVLDTVCSGEKEIYRIRTKNNEIESSEEHNVMVFENNDFVYKSVCDLKLKDLLVINKEFDSNQEVFINKNFDFSKKNYNGYRNSKINIPNIVDEDFSKLFGFMLGDGWVSNNTVCIALGVDEDMNNEYISLLEKFSGKKAILKENPNKKGKLKYSQAWVNSKMLKEILILNGFRGKSWEKRLPKWVFTAKNNIKEAMIQGLIDSDGSINIDEYNCKRYSFEVVSEYLVKDLKYLLQTMGRKTGKICSRNRNAIKIWGKKYKKRKCFYLYFYDSNIKQSVNCDFNNRKSDNFIIAPIVSIEKLEDKQLVYDIHVESENHNFYANGIVVHNSILDPARKLWKQLQLAEDSMLVYRITRAPERRVFYIDVGNLEHADVSQFIQQFQMQLKKQPIVDQKTGNMNMKYNPMNVTEDYFIPMRAERSSRIETLPGACIALDTKIPLLDGRTLELQEIIKEWDSGNRNMWVYSCDPKTGKLAPGMITWAGETRKNAETINITLDNGKVLTTTPDHKWVHRTKGFVEAKDLAVGDSLMPFYRDEQKILDKKYSKKYERVWDSEKQEWIFTHRMVSDFMKQKNKEQYHIFEGDYEKNKMKTIHHMDNDRFNNSPNNLFLMDSRDHYRYHRHDLWSTPEKSEKNRKKIQKGINRFISFQSCAEKNKRKTQSIENLKNATITLQKLMEDENYKKEFYEKTSKTLKIVKNTPEAKKRQSEIAKQQWKNSSHKEKVFKVKQTLVFTETLYNMFFDMFKKTGRADLALFELNKSKDFLNEFKNKNKDIRSSLTNLNNFTHNHLEKMLKERGFKNYRDWCKITAEELGYKNVRAWRYYIEKNKKNELEKFYNHKIIKIEIGEIQDTGTITVDGDELFHNYHTFATEAGNFLKNSNLGDIQDIEYLQNKLFASLQVPKNYLNYGESLPGGSTLSQQDLRFARTINTIQQAVLAELKRIANIHLYFNGFKDDIDNFTLTLNNPSTQQELLKLETMKARLEVFKEMFSADATSPVSYVWAMENILGFSKNEIKLILKQKKVEKKIFAEIDSAVEMYKKIGLFKELDERYEIEGAEEMMQAQQSGEGGDSEGEVGGGLGGSFGGGSGFGGADDLGLGGEEEVGGAPEGGEGGEGREEAVPMAESRFRKAQKISDNYVDNMLNELLGVDEPKIKKSKIEDNALIKKGNSIKSESKKLIDSISDGLASRGMNKGIIKEEVFIVPQNNSLLNNSKLLEGENQNLMDEIEKYLMNRKK